MTDLFSFEDFASYLQIPEVDNETVTRVRRIASGWLMAVTGATSWPDPVPDDLWSWAIELAACVYYNPSGLNSENIDDHSATYSPERRDQILKAAAASVYSTGAKTQPVYSFPPWDWTWTSTTPSTFNALTN